MSYEYETNVDPKSINEWMTQLAFAIEHHQEDTIDSLQRVSESWIQDSEALDAQVNLIFAIRELIES